MTHIEFRAALAFLRRTAPTVAKMYGYSRSSGNAWATGERSIPAHVAEWVTREVAARAMNPVKDRNVSGDKP